MSAQRGKDLSEEDRVLWSLVARTARPLKGREAVPIPSAPEESATVQLEQAIVSAVPQHSHRKGPAPVHALDRPSAEKLAKGRLPIEGRVDLHGMTQSEAHGLLLSFLRRAHAGGIRYVLIITGKGSSGEGVLRRAVPAWLSTAPFQPLVSSHAHAARHHGGAGAIYVRLRRREAER